MCVHTPNPFEFALSLIHSYTCRLSDARKTKRYVAPMNSTFRDKRARDRRVQGGGERKRRTGVEENGLEGGGERRKWGCC